MAKQSVTRFLLTSEFSDLEKVVRKFFKARFKRDPKFDRGYYQEWLMRFRSGTPDTYMDSQSLKVWNRQKKKLEKVI